jgi:hypothetical protein
MASALSGDITAVVQSSGNVGAILKWNYYIRKGGFIMVETLSPQLQKIIDNLPEVEYPQHVLDRWTIDGEIALAKYAAGELRPTTAANLAAEFGFSLRW